MNGSASQGTASYSGRRLTAVPPEHWKPAASLVPKIQGQDLRGIEGLLITIDQLRARVADLEDRRALRVALTESGIRMWADIHQCGLRVRQRALENMSADEQDALLRMLAQVRENLNREDD